MKSHYQTYISAFISAGALMLVSNGFCNNLADAIKTKTEADTAVLLLTEKLKTKLVCEPTSINVVDSATLDQSATAVTDTDGHADTDEVPAIIGEMEVQLVQVKEIAKKLKNLETGEFREAELADWNAKYGEIKDLLGQLLEQQSDNGISDDLAPILEGIRKEFRLETPDVTRG